MNNDSKKIFKTPIAETVTNFKTGEICHLVSNEKEEYFTETDFRKIATICNQPAVYDFLFRDRLEGKIYEIENAKSFVKWMIEGWDTQKWFVFLVRNIQKEIVAAIDIKSNNLDSAEIGCWADENHPGIMTNATKKVIELAIKAKFKELFALIKPSNIRSQNVVTRCGFIFDGETIKDDELLQRYHIELN